MKLTSYVGTYSGSGISTSAGIAQFFLFRDPLRSAVVLSANVPAYSYVANFAAASGLSTNSRTLDSAYSTTALEPFYFYAALGGPHGSYLYCGKNTDAGGKTGYFWVDYGATLNVTQNIAKTSDSFKLYTYANGDEQTVRDTLFTSTSFDTVFDTSLSASCTRGSYVRVEYVNGSAPDAGQTVSLTIFTTAASDSFAHLSLPSLDSHFNQVSYARVNAASLLLRNVAAPIYQEGSIQAIALNPTTDWRTLIGNTSLVSLSNNVNTYEGPLKTGFYTFLKVATIDDLNFRSYSEFGSNGVLTDFAFPLQFGQFVAVTAMSQQIGTTFPGFDFILHVTDTLEFQVNDQWYDARVTPNSINDTNEALEILRREVQFFENPTHLEKISRFVANAGALVRRHAGRIGSALSMLFPQHAAWIAPLSKYFASD